MPSGGYHAPSNPAQVSGPGALSRRTDQPQPMQQLSNPKYGEQSDFQQIQAGAPMSAPPSPGIQAPIGLGEPSANPSQPVTAGAAAGAGPGTEALGLPSTDRDALRKMYGPVLPQLIAKSQSKYASQDFKDAVAALIAIL